MRWFALGGMSHRLGEEARSNPQGPPLASPQLQEGNKIMVGLLNWNHVFETRDVALNRGSHDVHKNGK